MVYGRSRSDRMFSKDRCHLDTMYFFMDILVLRGLLSPQQQEKKCSFYMVIYSKAHTHNIIDSTHNSRFRKIDTGQFIRHSCI